MSYILPHSIDKIPHPFIAVCAGMGDARFISSLLNLRKITNCSVGCPSDKGGHGMGKEAILSYLRAVQAAMKTGKAALRGLVVVADADVNPDQRFTEIADAIRDAGFPVPTKAFSIEGDPLRVGVYIIPGVGRTGTLEHLLWDAALKHNPAIENCVDNFSMCMGGKIAAASENKQAKMKMSAIVAASCQDNPWASPALIWSDKGNPVPIDSECFSHCSDFLVQFTSL